MFNRVEIKQNAKNSLKHFYFMGLLACFLYALLSGKIFDMWENFHDMLTLFLTGDTYTYGKDLSTVRRLLEQLGNPYQYYYSGGTILAMILGSIFAMVRAIVRFLYITFIVNVLEVGMSSFFLKNRYQDTGVNELLVPFQNRYTNVVKVLFLQKLYILLWTLLFVIPGIIKSYEYFFVPYLMAENPEFTAEKALSLSRKMTDGEKFNIFIFEFSFLGWVLLTGILGGFGWIFVMPYYWAAKSELYVCLKQRKL